MLHIGESRTLLSDEVGIAKIKNIGFLVTIQSKNILIH